MASAADCHTTTMKPIQLHASHVYCTTMHMYMCCRKLQPHHTVDPPTPALPFTAHQTGGVSLLCEDGRLSACHAPAASLSADNWPTGALRLYESPVENLTYTVKSVGSRLFCRGGGGGRSRGAEECRGRGSV